MMIERNIDKNNWRINLPSELMEELGWEKGDTILFEIREDKLIAINKEDKTEIKNRNLMNKLKKEVQSKEYYPNGKKIPPKKKTPCGLFEFTKRKYVENKCKKCNANYELLMNNPNVYCPIAEKNTKEAVTEIAKNIDNENKTEESPFKEMVKIIKDSKEKCHKLLLKEQEEIKLKMMKERFEELSRNKIELFSSLSKEEQNDYISYQSACPVCNNRIIKRSNIIYNGKLVCSNCSNLIKEEMKEFFKIKNEIDKIEKGGK